jgi:hypothetical protein
MFVSKYVIAVGFCFKWYILYNGELHCLYCTPAVIRVIKSWAKHEVRAVEIHIEL